MPVVSNRLTVLSIVLFTALTAVHAADKEPRFLPGRADSYPIRQTNEKVTIAAAPYATDDLTRVPFGKLDPNKYGVLPVLIVIQNDTGKALRLERLKVDYIAPNNGKIESTPAKDVPYLRGLRMPSIQNSPLPTGGARVSRKKNPLADPTIDLRAFSAKMLPAGEQASGFFYFQTLHRWQSKIYVTGIEEAATGKELFYFEIPLTEDRTQ